MSALAKAWVEIGVDNARLGQGLRTAEGQTKGALGRIGSMFGGLGIAAAAAIGGGTIYGIKKSVDAFKEQEMAVRKLEAVLKSTKYAAGLTAAEIEDFAAQRQGVTNFGDEVTIAGAAVLATFKEVRGEAFKDTLAVAQDMSTVLGTDLKGTLLQVGKAMNDPILGATALTRAGVQFTAVQKENIKGFVATNQLAKAQAIVMGELQSQFGGAAEAVVDPMKQFKNQVGDLAENIGSVFAPTIDMAAGHLRDFLGDVNSNADAFKAFGENVALTFDNLPLAIEKAGIGMTLALMEAVPGMEAIFTDFAITAAGMFAGVEAAWKSMIANLVLYWEEHGRGLIDSISNVPGVDNFGIGKAVTDGVFGERAGAGELAELKKAANAAGNPFEAAGKAFREEIDRAADGLAEQGGLGAALRNRLDAIDDEFASRRSELFKAKEDVKAAGAMGDGAESPGGSSKGSRGGAFSGLAEMAKKIQGGLSPGDRIAKEQAKDVGDIKKWSERQVSIMSDIREDLRGSRAATFV